MIPSHLHSAFAQARVDDLHRAAAAGNLPQWRAQPERPVGSQRSVTLRFSSPADERVLARLAALDSSSPPAQPVLLAEVDGQPLAALGVSDGTVIADPFHRTADLVDLLRARARQLNSNAQVRRRGRLRAWSRLRAPAWR